MFRYRWVLWFGCLLGVLTSCKKNSANDPSVSPTPVVSSFTIDASVMSNPTHTSFMNGNNFGVIAYGTNANPQIQLTFFGSGAPSTGTYPITAGSLTYGMCTLTLSDTGYTSTASYGSVYVTTSSAMPKNTLSFTNIAVSGAAGSHRVSGTITY